MNNKKRGRKTTKKSTRRTKEICGWDEGLCYSFESINSKNLKKEQTQ